jgi:hypothetical protein
VARIGIIAGNGKFPFLALQGARDLGHEVTVIAIKEEAFADLEEAARRAGATLHCGVARPVGQVQSSCSSRRRVPRRSWRQVRTSRFFSGIVPDFTLLSVLTRLKARNTDALISGGRRRDAVTRDRTDELDNVSRAAARQDRSSVRARVAPDEQELRRFEFGYRIWPMLLPRSTSARTHRRQATRAVVAVEAMEGHR